MGRENRAEGVPHNGVRKTKTHRFLWTNSEHILQPQGVVWGVGVDQGRPFEDVCWGLAQSGRRRMSPSPRLLGSQAGGMASQEILTGTTAADETPPIGTLRQSPFSGTHPPHPPQGHAPTT